MSGSIYTDGSYLRRNPTWHAEDSRWKADHVFEILRKNRIAPMTVCEVGYGAGEVLHQLHGLMPDNVTFSGYEISPQAYEMARPKSKDRLSYHLKDLLEERDARFDVVLVIDVLEHVEDIYGFLRGLHPKGRHAVFHIPLDLSVYSVLRTTHIIDERRRTGHIHYFTKETALATLRDAGYEILDHYYTASAVELPRATLKENLARYPRRVLYKVNADLTVKLLGGYSLIVLAR